MKSGKLCALVGALLAVAALSSSAHAEITGELIAPGGAISQPSLGAITFSASGVTIACRLTLNGSLEAALVRVGAAIGSISEVRWSECTGGELASFLVSRENPIQMIPVGWLVRETLGSCNLLVGSTQPERPCGYLIRLRFFRWLDSVFGGFVRCLYEGGEAGLKQLIRLRPKRRANEFELELLTILPSTFRLISGAGCPATSEMAGTFGSLSPTQAITFL